MIASRRPLLTRYLSAAAGFVGMPPPPIGRKRKTGHPVYFRRQGGPVRSFHPVLFGRSPVPTLAREETTLPVPFRKQALHMQEEAAQTEWGSSIIMARSGRRGEGRNGMADVSQSLSPYGGMGVIAAEGP